MGHDLLARCLAGDLAHAFGVGNAEDLACLQAIDVVRVEGRAVALEQGRQHLLDGDAVGTVLEGDPVEGVARLDQIGAPPCSHGGCRCLTGRARRGGPPVGLGSPGVATRFRACNDGGGSAGAGVGGIEEEGVLADQTPGRPVKLDQHVDERLVDRPVAGDADDRAVAPPLDGHAQAADGWRIIDTRLTEGVRGGEPGGQALELFRGRRDFHLGTQRLSQAAQDGDPTETCRTGAEGYGTDRRRDQGAF